MKAQEWLAKIAKQKELENLLESYTDSDWVFYLQMKHLQEVGISKSFYTTMSPEQLNDLMIQDENKFINQCLQICFTENFISVFDTVADFSVLQAPKAYFFRDDKVQLSLNHKSLMGLVANAPGKPDFISLDYQPGWHRVEIEIKLIGDGKIRENYEAINSNRTVKTELFLTHLQKKVHQALLQEQGRLSQNRLEKQREIAQEVATRYGWDLNNLPSTGMGTGRLWDFELRDLALIRQLFQSLRSNSNMVLFLSAKRLERILQKQIEAERESAQDKLMQVEYES